jgi:hypothetical protein
VTPGDAFAMGPDPGGPAVRLCLTGPPDAESLTDALGTVVELLELGPGAAARDM